MPGFFFEIGKNRKQLFRVISEKGNGEPRGGTSNRLSDPKIGLTAAAAGRGRSSNENIQLQYGKGGGGDERGSLGR